VIGGDRFVVYWSQFTRALKRGTLFLMTISYLPVARVTLENFAGEYDNSILDLYNCQYTDRNGDRCCLKAIPNRPCITSDDFDELVLIQVWRVNMMNRSVL
jgi:hypothetical protein